MNRIGLTLCVFLALYYEANSAGYQPSAEDAPAPGENPDKPSPPPPYALSYVYVKHLAKIEEELYQIMQNYEAALKLRLKIVSNYVKDYEDSTLKGTKHLDGNPDPMAKAAAVASHPLMAYRLIKRYASEIDALGNNLAKNPESHIKKRVSEMMDGRPWPTKSDNEAAMDGLLRMHYVYNFDLKEFTSGKIGDIQTNVGLTAKQTFHIAKFATYASFHTQAMDWLKVTSWKVLNKTDEGSNDIGVNTIALAYKNAVDKHNQEIESTNNTGNLYTYTSKILGNDLPPKKRDATLDLLQDAEKLDWEEIVEMDESEAAERSHFDYISLCNGKGTQTEAEKAELYCYYERKKNPYWYINPLKTEILNLDPPLIQMYDFIGDKWIEYLIEKATPISRAPPPSDGTATPRSAAYAWLNDSDIPETPLSRRIELITGLNVRGEEASTALQIASYIFGGHVANHVDSLGEDADDRGDRVTTFLIYMNDVPAGGYTAYPVLGTFVRPIKGSAILWYDSLKNGDIDNRMLHGACPPIFGHKWIATKWTHLNENMFTRPCDLDPEV